MDTAIWQALFEFQRDGVRGAINNILTHNGCIIADSVGLGKTYEALAVIRYFELRNARVLVLCPKKLRENWTVYQAQNRKIQEECMPTTITLPEHLARQLQQRAVAQQRTPEALAIDLIALGLGEMAADASPSATVADPELSAVVARITATPPNPDSIIPARGNLADLLRSLEAMEGESDVAAESAALQAAEAELRAINRADDVAEGRG